MSAAANTPAGSRITLRGALIALGVLLVGINVGSAVWDARTDRARTELRAQRDFSNLTSLLAEQSATLLEAVDLVLRDVARDGSSARGAALTQRLSDEIVHIQQVAAVLVLDAGGHVIARTNEAPSIDTGVGERLYFTAHRDGRTEGLFFSEPYQTVRDGRWRFAMSRRLDATDGRFVGVVVAAMDIESFDRLYGTIDLGDGGFITLRAQNGTVITRVPDPASSRGRDFANPDIDAGVRREGRFTGWTTSPILNERVLLAVSSVRGFPIHVLSGATERSVLAPWHNEASRIAVRTLLTSAAMLALITLAAWGLARREQALQRERKLADAERGRLEQRLRQAEKMEAIGRLAGGIAHDFNNILGGILGYAEMLFEQTAEGSPLKRYARNVLTAANRARGLVDQILAYSRTQRGKRVPVDFGRIAAETLELVRGSLRPGVQLEAKLPATPLLVVGDPTQLHQILMNLCTNAIQAMGEDGTLRVVLEAVDAGAERAVAHGTLQPGAYVRLTVGDTGPGMDEATIARIFEPFFTTKEVGKGTGLGLSLVYGIVTDSGGAIDVASAVDRGSSFTIYLPRVDTAVEVADENQGPVPRGNGERVLVVDDEESLVAVTSEVLLRLGYEPVGFSDSRAALAAFESAPERFDAAITDEVMPGLTGTELAALLRRRRAGLPIVLVSGYIGPLLAERAHGAGVTEILKKPVHSRDIAAALAHVLRRVA
jgi:signal transduction histidine kinase/CheY-like chemotaxis protein